VRSPRETEPEARAPRIAPGDPQCLPTVACEGTPRRAGVPFADSGDDRYTTLVRVVIGRSSRSLTVSQPRPKNRRDSYYPILERQQQFGWWREEHRPALLPTRNARFGSI
jgi:hypothetical protein